MSEGGKYEKKKTMVDREKDKERKVEVKDRSDDSERPSERSSALPQKAALQPTLSAGCMAGNSIRQTTQ